MALALVALVALCAALGLARLRGAPFAVVRSGETTRTEEVGEAVPGGVEAEGPSGDDGDVASALGEGPPAVDEAAVLVVHVDGAVATPGVYRLEGGDLRLVDAVTAAGGLLPDADTSTLNLAAPLVDGAKVHVPAAGEEAVSSSALGSQGQADAAGSPVAGTGGATLVNINTAGTDELRSLPGIGEVLASAIVEDRARNGPFATPEDLMRVSGIGEKKYERLKELIDV